ncbi:hypothetical protein ARMSODRAFT_202825 [Armillaria solidipes]|uniref:Uncharacterized protein n=1 Tax=Armillaria solidipes TaxID=1076256 RepID=A0A2H3BN68_9AGAR|nr:hypothetical protein ARMSODRAFT_202825 [Armillaria solidipes]
MDMLSIHRLAQSRNDLYSSKDIDVGHQSDIKATWLAYAVSRSEEVHEPSAQDSRGRWSRYLGTLFKWTRPPHLSTLLGSEDYFEPIGILLRSHTYTRLVGRSTSNPNVLQASLYSCAERATQYVTSHIFLPLGNERCFESIGSPKRPTHTLTRSALDTWRHPEVLQS